MIGSVFLKNAQVSGGAWINMGAETVAWNLDIFNNVPLRPMQSGIPAHEGDYLGLDNPGLTMKGFINFSNNDYINQINFKNLERFAMATGLTWYLDGMYVDPNKSIHSGSMCVMFKGIGCDHSSSSPLKLGYTINLIAVSGV